MNILYSILHFRESFDACRNGDSVCFLYRGWLRLSHSRRGKPLIRKAIRIVLDAFV